MKLQLALTIIFNKTTIFLLGALCCSLHAQGLLAPAPMMTSEGWDALLLKEQGIEFE